MNRTSVRHGHPEISVVIATRDRMERLERCLASLERQTVPLPEFEVIVVDDGSTDGTSGLLEAMRPPFALTVLRQGGAGSAAARNHGALHAKGRLVLFLDDDEEADPGLIAAHLAAHRTGERLVVCGAIRRQVPRDADPYAVLQMEDGNARIAELASRALTYWDCCGGNLSLTQVAFDEAGGFAPELRRENDTDLAYRLQAAGLDLVFDVDAAVTEHRTRPWRQILADIEARGRVAVELYRRHPPMIAAMPLGRRDELPRTRAGQAVFRTALGMRVPMTLLGLVGLLPWPRAWRRAWFFSVLATLAYWRGVRAASDPELWRRLRSGTLILCYHAFGTNGEAPSRFVVSGRRFARQLDWLRRRRYNVISLGEYIEYRSAYRLPPARTVVITIDDGYRDTLTVAGPILERFGLKATVFLISSQAGQGARTDEALVARPLIDSSSAHELLGGPFELGAHTRTHPVLTALSEADARSEIAGSKRDLELALDRPVTSFSYPFGASDGSARRLVAEAGYHAARGIHEGCNYAGTDSFDLRRVEVPGTLSLARFALKVLRAELRGR